MGKRTLEKEGKKLNILKVIIAIILISLTIILCIYGFANIQKPKNDEVVDLDFEPRMLHNEKKTIEQILNEFGGEAIEKVKDDTYYIKKDNIEYTAYLDGEIVEGRVIPWDGSSNKPAIDEAGNINIYNAAELKWIADQVISGEKNFNGVTITLRSNLDFGAREVKQDNWEGNEWTSIIGFLERLPDSNEENLKRFAGVFNGNNFSIRGIYINSEQNYQGLFGYNSGEIINLTLKYSKILGGQGTGAIARIK